MKSLSFVLAGGMLASLVAATAAPAQDAETVLKAREAHMTLNGFNLGPLVAMTRGDIDYDAELASASAANLAALAAMDQSRLWAPGSGRPDFENSRALPAIWENFDDVQAKIAGLAEATAALAPVAGNGLEALQAAMGPVGQACGACHRTYRAEE